MATTIRPPRIATPERWRQAVKRAIAEGIQVRQLAGSGAWISTSGSDSSAAYELEVTGEIAHGCSCLAGSNGDPVCKHRAAFYLAIGMLEPEPEPPAPASAPCGSCSGRGWETVVGKSGAAYRFDCQVCEGTGAVEVADDEPAPPAPAAPAPLPCPGCAGAGSQRIAVHSPLFASLPIQCPTCRGAGRSVAVAA